MHTIFKKMTVIAIILLSFIALVSCLQPKYQHPEEWQLWKTEHGKSYESQREELERHLVWLSNREYINAHNKNAEEFGFIMSMNQFSDRVSHTTKLHAIISSVPHSMMVSLQHNI